MFKLKKCKKSFSTKEEALSWAEKEIIELKPRYFVSGEKVYECYQDIDGDWVDCNGRVRDKVCSLNEARVRAEGLIELVVKEVQDKIKELETLPEETEKWWVPRYLRFFDSQEEASKCGEAKRCGFQFKDGNIFHSRKKESFESCLNKLKDSRSEQIKGLKERKVSVELIPYQEDEEWD